MLYRPNPTGDRIRNLVTMEREVGDPHDPTEELKGGFLAFAL
jgi:hypothetical protein